VGPGAPTPAGWEGCERYTVDTAVLGAPAEALAWFRARAGTSVVVELVAEFEAVPDVVESRPQHALGPGFEVALDELHWAVWSNAVDARTGRWPAVDAAVALGARPAGPDEPGDVVLPGGQAVWIDAGPPRHHDPVDGVPVLHVLQLDHRRLELPHANVTTAELAPDQLAAVTHAGGSARIIAPAGSGKTRVLTERARHVITAWRLPPGAVSLVAFNKRAQEEMQARTADLRGLPVRTLNAIALAIVNGVAPFAPQQRQWRTIDEPDVRRILQRFVQMPRKLNVDPLAPWIDALSLVRLGLVDPSLVEAQYDGDVDGLAEVWPLYRDALERQGVVDFDDQIRRAIDVLLTQPAARRTAQRACRVLLVDEFQDLTPAHLLLVRLLSGRGGAVFGVGDDDQTIYGYNGADPGWLIDFARWFPGSGDHPLEVNYRCPAGIVEVADRLLRHNRRRVPKTIRAASADRGGWTVHTSDDPVAATLAAVRAAQAGGAPLSDVAVLTRVNATLAPVQFALATEAIGFHGGVGTEFADRTAVRAALAWLRLALGGAFEPADLGEALRRPSRALHPRVREWVGEQRDVEGLLRLSNRVTNEKDAARIADFAGDIGRLRAMAARRANTAEVMRALVVDIGLGGAVTTLDANRHGMNRTAQGDDLIALRQLAALHPDVATFERRLRELLASKRDLGGVTLATVHRVKGQEWPYVVVHLAQGDQFPHRLSVDIEEERRLFHVAITRASRHVAIVTGDHPSPFVAELTTEPSATPDPGPDRAQRRAERAAPTPARRETPDHPLLERDRVMAAVGLVLVDQGQEWTIVELEPAAAVAARNGAVRRFALGEKVETAGRQRGPLRPRTGEVDEAAVRLFDLLRQFRERVRSGKPAYTVFDDKTLAAIASAAPADLAALAAVRGVGPAKLEQYGDDVLELAALAAAPEPG
jgi:DNA helicase-2/ATP-dependent DNA helicase PcrA